VGQAQQKCRLQGFSLVIYPCHSSLQGSADAEHKELKEGLAKAIAKARDLSKVSGVERFGFADVKVIKVRTSARSSSSLKIVTIS